MQVAGSALKEIIKDVDHVTGMIQQIAAASEEQSTAADQISGDIEAVANITRNAASGAQHIYNASGEIAEFASDLQKTVAIFMVSDDVGDMIRPFKDKVETKNLLIGG